MKIIDAHMHYYDIDKFYEVAENAGHENTAACWQQICQENNIRDRYCFCCGDG